MLDQLSVEVFGKKVNNPVLKVSALVLMVATALTSLAILSAIFASILAGMLALTVPVFALHFLLKATGRQGFVTYTSTADDTHFHMDISDRSFRKVK